MSATEWTPNDYSNIATVGAAALCSVLMVLFKSRCSNISICYGLLSCKRKPMEEEEDGKEEDEDKEEPIIPPTPRRSPRLTAPEPEVQAADP
jgi:hypothetical protein